MTAASRSESKIQYKLATRPSEHRISHFVTVLSPSPTGRLLVFLIPCDYSTNHVATPPRFSRKYSCCPSVAGIILLPELWRKACSVTAFLIPAASAASWNRRLSWRVVIGLLGLLPGNSQRSCAGVPAS